MSSCLASEVVNDILDPAVAKMGASVEDRTVFD